MEKSTRRGRVTRKNTIERVYPGSQSQNVSSGDERWYYDPGPGGFVYVLEFVRSRINTIKTEGYGTDKGIRDWNERKQMIK